MGVLPLKKENDELRAVIERALSEGPLTITRDGVPAAVIVPAEEYQRLTGERRPDIIEYLLRPLPGGGIDLDEYIGPRSGPSSRPPPDFD